MRGLRRILEYVSYRFFAFFIPLLPRPVVVWMGRRIGAAYLWLSPRTRRVGMENLRRALPERTDHRRILRRSLRHQAIALLDALWCRKLDPEKAKRYVDVQPEAVELIQRLVAEKRGAVIATAHFGSWEMFNLGAAGLGLPNATVIAREVRNKWIDRHFKRTRQSTGNQIVFRDEALVACLAALRRGEIVVSVIDIAVLPSEGGMYFPFFGTPATTSAALPMLAVRRKAPLFFVVCRPLDNGRRYILEGERIDFDPDAPTQEEVERVTGELNRALERRVREHPDCWLWSYKRWKWRPGELGQELFPSYSLWHVPHH